MSCPLCDTLGGRLVYQGAAFRVIHADEPGFPAFYRVVWQSHRGEFSDLTDAERQLCMAAVSGVERALRDTLAPSKINLAALGNMVPHLHWHVIARFEQDSHFPSPVWAAAQRECSAELLARVAAALPVAEAAMIAALTTLESKL